MAASRIRVRLSSEAIERSVNSGEDRDTLSRRATAVRHARRRLHALPAGRVREPRAQSTRRPRRSRRASRRRSHAADGHGLGHGPAGGQRVRRLRPSSRRGVRTGALRTSRRRAGELPAWSRCAPRHRARRRPRRRRSTARSQASATTRPIASAPATTSTTSGGRASSRTRHQGSRRSRSPISPPAHSVP